jgi:hypothetical protein
MAKHHAANWREHAGGRLIRGRRHPRRREIDATTLICWMGATVSYFTPSYSRLKSGDMLFNLNFARIDYAMEILHIMLKAFQNRPEDALRLVLGTFFGAGLAFLASQYLDSKRRRLENIAAGNMALITVVRQLREFRQFREQFFSDVNSPIRQSNTPLYLMVRPSLQVYLDNEIDVSSLVFLLQKKGASDAINAMENANLTYASLVKADTFRNETIVSLQERLADAQAAGTVTSDAEIRKAIGPFLTATAEGVITILAHHATQDEAIYQTAFIEVRKRLTQSLVPWWCPKTLSTIYQKHFRSPPLIGLAGAESPNLPKLPEVLQRALKLSMLGREPVSSRPSWQLFGKITPTFRITANVERQN